MAGFNVGAIEGTLTLDRNPFQRSLREARAEADAFSRKHITPEVDLADRGARAKLDWLKLQLERLDHRSVTVDVDVRRGFFERLASIGATAAQGLASGLQTAFGAGGRLLSGFTSALAGLPSLIQGAAVAILIVLLPALAALAASLAAAAAGLAVLGLGFAAAFGPLVLVGIALASRFAAIIKTRQAREQELAQAVSAEKTAEQQRQAALQASRSAHQRLAETVVAGRRAMIQSAFDLRDAELGLERSRFGVEQARLNIAQARKDLREFLAAQGASGHQLDALLKQFTDVSFHPGRAADVFGQTTGKGLGGDQSLELRQKILNLRGAQLSYRESVNQVTHAEDALSQAQSKRAAFLKQGLDAYGPYVEAVKAAHQADARLLIAQEKTTRAQDAYRQKLAALTGTEQGTLGVLDKIIKGFTSFAKILTDPIFRAINDVFGSLHGKFGSLRGPLQDVGEAMGEIVRSFGKFLGERRTITFFQEAARTAASLARSLGVRAFPDFLRIMRNLALAVFPDVRKAGDAVARVMHSIFLQTTNATRLRNLVRSLVDNLKTWLGIGYQLGRVFIAFIRDAVSDGRHFGNTIRTWLKNLADFLNTKEGREEVHAWITRSISAANSLAKAFWGVVKALNAVIDAVNWIKRQSAHLADTLGLGDRVSAQQIQADLNAIGADRQLLHTHLTSRARQETRKRLLDTINDLLTRHLEVPLGEDAVKRLRALQDQLNQAERGSHASVRPSAHGSSIRRPAAHASGGDLHQHFTINGITNPDHIVAKIARKLPRHPGFSAERRRNAQRRGKVR